MLLLWRRSHNVWNTSSQNKRGAAARISAASSDSGAGCGRQVREKDSTTAVMIPAAGGSASGGDTA